MNELNGHPGRPHRHLRYPLLAQSLKQREQVITRVVFEREGERIERRVS